MSLLFKTLRRFRVSCDEKVWPHQGGTIIEPRWDGFELKTAHPYSKAIDDLFEALLHEFETTNYDVGCSGIEQFGKNMLTASIYIIEKN